MREEEARGEDAQRERETGRQRQKQSQRGAAQSQGGEGTRKGVKESVLEGGWGEREVMK